MTEKLRNNLFYAYLIECTDNLSDDSTFEERSQMLNNLNTIHSTSDSKKVFAAIRNKIEYK